MKLQPNQKGFTPRTFLGKSSEGFTLVELLLAMAFFSAALVLISGGFIQIIRIYQSAVITKNAQNTTKSIFEQISRDAKTGEIVAAAPTPLPAGITNCFNVGSVWYALTANYELWRIPGSNSCDPASPGAYLMHEKNLSTYRFNVAPVMGRASDSLRSMTVDLTIGVLNSSADEIVDESTARCQTTPIILRLCSVVNMHTAITLRNSSL